MKMTMFTFKFAGGKISTWEFSYDRAAILAQAEAIKRGWDYKIIG